MNELRDCAAGWLAGNLPAVVVTVASADGSTPRESGTRMLVAADRVAGTIGGGHLELEAITIARNWRDAIGSAGATAPVAFEKRYSLGPSLGQCCGGSLTLRFEPLTPRIVAAWPDESRLFHVALFGAGHVGRALIRTLEDLPCTVDWIDERDAQFALLADERNPRPPAANIRTIAVDQVVGEVASIPAGAFCVVMTHSHDLDQAICEAVLQRDEFGFLGLIGSKTKRARFIRRFRQHGIDESLIARLHCPIGVAGIAGKQPAVIAVAVAAQLLQVAGGDREPAPATIDSSSRLLSS